MGLDSRQVAVQLGFRTVGGPGLRRWVPDRLCTGPRGGLFVSVRLTGCLQQQDVWSLVQEKAQRAL